ncbi:MAG: hypothetical protein HOV81_09330 [Kofleriaceae bacterium]|nr:hypothetical protein [Kofleriaceae bacterium]
MTVLEEFMRVAREEDVQVFAASVDAIDDQVMTIVGFIEIALLRAGDDEALRADLQEIRDAAIRAVEKTGDLRPRRAKTAA